MRHIGIHIVLLFISFESFSQMLVWEKLIDYFPSNVEYVSSVEQDSDSTFFFFGTNSSTNTYLVKAKLNGDTLWKKNYNVNTMYGYEFIAHCNGNLFHFGNKWIGSGPQMNFLFEKLSVDGNIISSWDYGDNGVINVLENYQFLPDGGFLASGGKESTYYQYFALMKLDSSGNLLWYKNYRDNSYTTDVIVNRKGNYLLSASVGDQIFAPVTYHPYFLEVNSDGDSITSKYLIVQADTVDEYLGDWGKNILQNEDGDYVFALRIDSVDQKGGTTMDRYGAVVMMDTAFNVKWKLYLHKGEGGGFYPTNIIELSDSTYILALYNTKPESNQFYFYKISKTGQLLDQKIFTSSLCNKIYPEIKLLNNGSLIVMGYCRDYENAYLARIDSVGLPMVLSAIDSPKEEPAEWSVEVYPNPFSDQITFRVIDKSSRSYTLTLYNNLGQQTGNYKFTDSQYTVEKKTLPAGLYFYKLASDQGEVRTGKIVAE